MTSGLKRAARAWRRYGLRSLPVGLAVAAGSLEDMRRFVRRTRVQFACRATIGPGTVISPGCEFTTGAWLSIGRDVFIGRNCGFYISEAPGRPPRPVRIGNRVWISQGFVLGSLSGVRIDDGVLIGEYVSVLDYTHAHADADRFIRDQGDIFGSVVIEAGAWIGRGCLVQGTPQGVVIGRGAIVGANSVVTRSIPPLEVWGGVPARFIHTRTPAARRAAPRSEEP